MREIDYKSGFQADKSGYIDPEFLKKPVKYGAVALCRDNSEESMTALRGTYSDENITINGNIWLCVTGCSIKGWNR
jgi:hypothetical protein